MGGARPKALLQMDGGKWVVKFAEQDLSSEPLIEHASMTLAAKAGIDVATTRPIPLAKGVAVAVKRFDRLGEGPRQHALSANVALKAAGVELSYPSLAQLPRRKGVTENALHRRQMHELFRRPVFNILMDNTDDHGKNHALLVTDAQHYVLAPAFDVLPAKQSLGYQSMAVGTDGAASSIDNALSRAQDYWLSRADAVAEASRVARVVDVWQEHFRLAGFGPADIDGLAMHIDRPGLREQRRELLGRGCLIVDPRNPVAFATILEGDFRQ